MVVWYSTSKAQKKKKKRKQGKVVVLCDGRVDAWFGGFFFFGCVWVVVWMMSREYVYPADIPLLLFLGEWIATKTKGQRDEQRGRYVCAMKRERCSSPFQAYFSPCGRPTEWKDEGRTDRMKLLCIEAHNIEYNAHSTIGAHQIARKRARQRHRGKP